MDRIHAFLDSQPERAFFLRDDDAVKPGPQLDRLLGLCSDQGVGPALAVIPAEATESLANRLQPEKTVMVWQHGYAHRNHAHINHQGPGQKKSEFSDARSAEAVATDLQAGWEWLTYLFEFQFEPIFVPPWNRFDSKFLPLLGKQGFRGFSDFGARTAEAEAAGLRACPTHLDPIDWRGSRSAVPEEILLNQLKAAFEEPGRQSGQQSRPIGFLTHHAVHDDATWAMVDGFVELIKKRTHHRWEPAVQPELSEAWWRERGI